MATEYPGTMRVPKTLASGERVRYVYHRPTMRRLYANPGTEQFAFEYAEAVRLGPKRKGPAAPVKGRRAGRV